VFHNTGIRYISNYRSIAEKCKPGNKNQDFSGKF